MIERMNKIRFIIIGSGWRALYYVRIAKALPEVFGLCAMYCRTEEKAQKIAEEYNIHTTTSIEECENYNPDFIVVSVNKESIAGVSMEWMKRGFAVLCETPAALDIEMLNKLWDMHNQGYRLVVAEQYTSFPQYCALEKLINQNIIGEPDCLNISLAHGYHGASLMRAFLKIPADMDFSVYARTYKFPTTETLTRYESYTDGRVANKARTVAIFEFADGKAGIYDFDPEQYRSPIRKNTLKLQGSRGEIIDRTVYYLNDRNEPEISEIQIKKRIVETDYDNPNLKRIEEVTQIDFEGEILYTPVFGQCGLSQDETAIASLMLRTYEYSKGTAPEPYAMHDALQDSYMAILLQQAVETGDKISSSEQVWYEADRNR